MTADFVTKKILSAFVFLFFLNPLPVSGQTRGDDNCPYAVKANAWANLKNKQQLAILSSTDIDDARKIAYRCVGADQVEAVIFSDVIHAICNARTCHPEKPIISPHKTWLPPGSYKKSCNGCRTVGRYLKCDCYTGESSLLNPITGFAISRSTEIRYDTCDSIVNDAGHLRCAEELIGFPEGSYINSCDRCSFHNGILTCRCKSGRLNTERQPIHEESSLAIKDCGKSTVINLFGSLTCSNAIPNGSYRRSCKELSIANGNLHYKCKNGRNDFWGNPKYTKGRIKVSKCKEYRNDRGKLRCE